MSQSGALYTHETNLPPLKNSFLDSHISYIFILELDLTFQVNGGTDLTFPQTTGKILLFT